MMSQGRGQLFGNEKLDDGEKGSNIVLICLTSFMDDPLPPQFSWYKKSTQITFD